jgi:hypothetical membrane protein
MRNERCPTLETVTPPGESGRRGTFLVIGALAWIVAATGYFVFEAVAAAAVEPAYGYATDYISSLGVPRRSPHAVLINGAFVTQAVLFPAGAALVVRGVAARKASWFLALAVVNGLGNVLVATVHSGTESKWHVAGAILAIAGGNAAVLVGSSILRRAGASRAYRAVSVVLGAVGLLCLLALAVDTSHAVLPVGIWERGSVYSIFVWQAISAGYLVGSRAQRW